MVSKEEKVQLRDVMNELDELDLPDGAYWAMMNERMGWDYGDAQEVIAGDPKFFGYVDAT